MLSGGKQQCTCTSNTQPPPVVVGLVTIVDDASVLQSLLAVGAKVLVNFGHCSNTSSPSLVTYKLAPFADLVHEACFDFLFVRGTVLFCHELAAQPE